MTVKRAAQVSTAAHEHALAVWGGATGEDVSTPEYRTALTTAVNRALAWVGGRSMRIVWPSYRNFKTTDDMWIPWAQAVGDWDAGVYDFRAASSLPAGRDVPKWGAPRPRVVYADDEPDMIEAEWRPLAGSVAFAGFEPEPEPEPVERVEPARPICAKSGAACAATIACATGQLCAAELAAELAAVEPMPTYVKMAPAVELARSMALKREHLRGRHSAADVPDCRLCRRHPSRPGGGRYAARGGRS